MNAMQRSTLIYIIAGVIFVGAAGTGVYLLRQRSLEGLQPAPPLATATSTGQGQQTGLRGKEVKVPGAESFIPAASGTAWNAKDLDAWKSVGMQYSPEEQANLSATVHADETLPTDVTKTWSPEFRAQMEAQQAKRR